MTNEQLVLMIQTEPEKRNAYLMELYNQNKKFFYKLARKYGHGVELDDLMQAAFLGMTAAAERFDVGHNVTFLTYCKYYVLNEIKRLDGLIDAESLDAFIGETELTLHDVISGETVNLLESVTDDFTVVREAVDKLPKPQAEVLDRIYWKQEKIQAIADDKGVPYHTIKHRAERGRDTLYRNPKLRQLAIETGYTSKLSFSSGLASVLAFKGSTVERLAEIHETGGLLDLRFPGTHGK